MQLQTYSWKQDGIDIYAESHLPDGGPGAVLCIVHGQSDHSGRFQEMAKYFNGQGIAVYAADLAGHGRSGGKRGHILHFEDYLKTVDALIAKAREAFPQVPLFVYGQSMGGNIILHHAANNSGTVKAYIASSPWIRLAFDPPAWKVTLGKWMRSIYPSLSQPTGLNAAHLSHDTSVVQAYTNDPLVHGKITASAFFETLQAGLHIPNIANKIKTPILLLHGTGDMITSHAATSALAAAHPGIMIYQAFEGGYHELHNEPEKLSVYTTILDFLRKNK